MGLVPPGEPQGGRQSQEYRQSPALPMWLLLPIYEQNSLLYGWAVWGQCTVPGLFHTALGSYQPVLEAYCSLSV